MDSTGPWKTERGCTHYRLVLSLFHWRWTQSKILFNMYMWRFWSLWLALWGLLFLAFYIWFCLGMHTFDTDYNSVWSVILCSLGSVLCCVQNKLMRSLANIVLCHSLLCWKMWSLAELLGKNDGNNQLSLHRALLCSNKSVANFYSMRSTTNYQQLLAFETNAAHSKHVSSFLNSCRARKVCVFLVFFCLIVGFCCCWIGFFA